MAIVKACTLQDVVKNTGVTCDKALAADAMIIAVPPGFSFDSTDMADPVTWMKTLIHAAVGTRVYPMFGQKAPIRTFEPKNESDVIVVLDDGSSHFLRYGFVTINYETTSGGLCYANALASFNAQNYDFIRIDKLGQMLVKDNGDGTYGALKNDFAYAPAPMNADLKTTPFKNRFMISYDPQELIDYGVVLAGGKSLLSMIGLIDATVTKAATASTTKLKIGVKVTCTDADLVALLGADLATASNFIVTNKATGAVLVVTAAIVSGIIELTGTFTSAATYNVIGAAPSVLYGNDVIGYDINTGVDILIP